MEKDLRVNKFSMDISQDVLDKALVYKRFIYKTLKDVQDGNINENEIVSIKMDLIYAVRFLYCVKMGINPKCIRIDFADNISEMSGNQGTIAVARKLGDLEKDSDTIFAEVVISSQAFMENMPQTIVFTVAHEFHHIFQHLKKDFGKFFFPVANRRSMVRTEFAKKLDRLRYDASYAEFDADCSSLIEILSWIDEVESLETGIKGDLQPMKDAFNSALSIVKRQYALSIAKKGAFSLVSIPELLVHAIGEKIMYDIRLGNSDSYVVYRRNVANLLNGKRTVKASERFVRKKKAQNDDKIYVFEGLRYIDSKIVLIANKFGVNPLALGAVIKNNFSQENDFVDRISFAVSSGVGEKRLLGVFKINAEGFEGLSVGEFTQWVDELFVNMENDENFLNAVEIYKKAKRDKKIVRKASSNEEEMGEE